MQVRNWLWVSDFANAIDIVLECGEAGEVYNVGGPDEKHEHRGGSPHPRAHRSRRVADLLRRTTASATTAATRCPRRRPRASGWKAAVAFDEGIERTVAWYRDNEWWWRPILSGEYARLLQAPLRQLMPKRIETRIDGLVLLEPASTATSAASSSRPSASATGGDAGSTAPSSRTTTRAPAPESCAAFTSRRVPGRRSSCAAFAGGSGTWPSTCAVSRRHSGSGRATSSTTNFTASSSSPKGFAHGFCVLSELADVHYQLSAYYDPATEAGFAWDDDDRCRRVADRRPAGLRTRRDGAEAGRDRGRSELLTRVGGFVSTGRGWLVATLVAMCVVVAATPVSAAARPLFGFNDTPDTLIEQAGTAQRPGARSPAFP